MNDMERMKEELYEVIRKYATEEASNGTLLAIVQEVAEVADNVAEELIDEVLDRL